MKAAVDKANKDDISVAGAKEIERSKINGSPPRNKVVGMVKIKESSNTEKEENAPPKKLQWCDLLESSSDRSSSDAESDDDGGRSSDKPKIRKSPNVKTTGEVKTQRGNDANW